MIKSVKNISAYQLNTTSMHFYKVYVINKKKKKVELEKQQNW